MPNRLALERSTYLLQHADNPVDWFPWGDEALELARRRQAPILLSIGYSACHWCHVMERESFSDEQIAGFMNANFVCIKVDREERPDLDAIYMEACRALTGRGGWPLNVFLTPAQVPFYAGSYFPPEPRHGLPSWRSVLEAVVTAWQTRRFQVDLGAERVLHELTAAARPAAAPGEIGSAMLDQARRRLIEGFDRKHGGFGDAPKFPAAAAIDFLLAQGERDVPARTLMSMACGGIYDQLGGGFARYTVDAAWSVPHFEKMLCDNAMLARSYLHGWQVTGEEQFRRVCTETLDWALRDMRGQEGGFCSALGADTGGEGTFYVWTLEELREALGELAPVAIAFFNVTAEGNFGGANVLVRRVGAPEPAELEQIRRRLLAVRGRRPRPTRDEKRLAGWNGLMISALAQAGAALGRPDYLDAARGCGAFLMRELCDADGHLLRSYPHGTTRLTGFLEDYALTVEALVDLYEATFEPAWLKAARGLAHEMITRFADLRDGGFFDTTAEHGPLIVRRKSFHDLPIPSGNASAALGLLRLAALTGERLYEERASRALGLIAGLAANDPLAHAYGLQALAFQLAPVKEVALVGEDLDELVSVVRCAFRPYVVVAGGVAPEVPLLAERVAIEGKPTAYVCEHFACRAPVTTPQELAALLA